MFMFFCLFFNLPSLNSDVRPISDLPFYPEGDRLAVPHLRNASSSFVRRTSPNGGVLQDFLNRLPPDWLPDTFLVTARVQRVVPGLYPSPPGYHLDHIPGVTSLDYFNPHVPSDHVICSVGAEANAPSFGVGRVFIDHDPSYSAKIPNAFDPWHYQVEEAIRRGDMVEEILSPNVMGLYSWSAFHTARASEVDEVRVLIRASRPRRPVPLQFNNATLPCCNELYRIEGDRWFAVR